MIYYFLIIGVFILIDQLTKYLTVKHLALYEVRSVFNGILSFTHIRNSGAAWSILEGRMIFFYLVTIVVVSILFFLLFKEKSFNWTGVGLSLLIGGALGNFIDRVLHQYVIDMIQLDFINFPIFNVADIALTIGACVLIVMTIIEDSNDILKFGGA